MKETAAYFRQYFREAWDLARLQWVPFMVAVVLMLSVWVASIYIPPGWVTYLTSFPASLIVALTALARVNDIGPERMGLRWQVRKIGLILAGSGSVMLMATPFLEAPAFPTWRAVVIVWGFALTWLTTPDHPPWDYYITGKYRFLSHPPDKPRSPLYRVVGRITKDNHSVAELMAAQKKWEEEQANKNRRRRGDGDGP